MFGNFVRKFKIFINLKLCTKFKKFNLIKTFILILYFNIFNFYDFVKIIIQNFFVELNYQNEYKISANNLKILRHFQK